MWQLWWEGDASRGYPPFRLLTGLDLKTRNEEAYLAKARRLIKVLLDIYDATKSTSDYNSMTIGERDAVFKSAIKDLFRYFSYPPQDANGTILTDAQLEKKRVGEKSYLTVYDHLNVYAQEHEVMEELVQNVEAR